MNWDAILMLATLTLSVFLVPTLLSSRAHVPRTTSGPFAVAIAVIALALLQLDNPLGAVANVLGALLWAAIFVLRGNKEPTSDSYCSGGPASKCEDCKTYGRCPTC